MEDFINKHYRKVDEMDFEGQKMAENIYKYFLGLATFLAFSIGFILDDMEVATYIVIGSAVFITLVIGVAWPCFKRNPVTFLQPIPEKSEVEMKDSS